LLNSFGSITSQTGATVDYDQFFSGLAWDADSQLYYARARWYDPTIGKFLAEDPLSFAGGDTNLSRYSLNDPVNRVDRNGLFSFKDVTNFVKDSFDVEKQFDRFSNNLEKAGNFFEKHWENGNIQKTLLVAGTIATGGVLGIGLAAGTLSGMALVGASLQFVSAAVNSYEVFSGDTIGDGSFSRYLSATAAVTGGFYGNVGPGFGPNGATWARGFSAASGLASGYEIASGRMIGDGTLSSVLHVGNLGVNHAGVFKDPNASLNQRLTVGINLAAGAASVASSGDPRLQQSLRSLSIAAGVWNTGTQVLYATQSVRAAAQSLRPSPPVAQSSGGGLYSVSDDLPATARRSRRSSYNPDVGALFSGDSQFTDGLMMTDPSVLDEPIFSAGDYGSGVGFASMNAGSMLNRDSSVFEQLDRNLFYEISMLYPAIDAARGLKQSYNDDSSRLAGGTVDQSFRNASALLQKKQSRLYALTGDRYSGDGKGYRNQLRAEYREAAENIQLGVYRGSGNGVDSAVNWSASGFLGFGDAVSGGYASQWSTDLRGSALTLSNQDSGVYAGGHIGGSFAVGVAGGLAFAPVMSFASGVSAFAPTVLGTGLLTHAGIGLTYHGIDTYNNWDSLSGSQRATAIGSPIAGFAGGVVSYGYAVRNYPEFLQSTFNAGQSVRNTASQLWADEVGTVQVGPLVRRPQSPADMTFKRRAEARAEAIRQHGGMPELFEELPVYGRNPNLRGPLGEASHVVHTVDRQGNLLQIQHHSNGHRFLDSGEFEFPHYHGVDGLGHLSYLE